ncbi:MAG TPA: serine hydrolase domain-containing protein [Terracidiphilus sp.]|nr:serine hydrolase domain-containing protein [Terracidiphilus sp.]
MRFSVPLLVGSLLVSTCFAQARKDDTPKPAQSIAELRQQLEKILADTHTPGLSVAIVRRDGPEWVAGLGKSNVAANQAATGETLFRIGSTSKGFVSLSILKLVNEGKLSLQDPVHKLVPEIWFENRWEASDPVRVVDLLEHTTGWDDIHMREYAKDAKGMTHREALDYDHHSRTSRWRPGTRMSYCNAGPTVAAYIVEKITGQRFEDYVTQNLFLPIGMKTATYFEQPSPQLTTLYHPDGKTPYPYWNIIGRPSGAINASAKDMAAYVQFYLNRGSVGGMLVMPAASIDRMETPTRTWEAQQGLKAGYGLSNYPSLHDGFEYHGHSGGVDGGLTDMAYMPEYGVGYSYSINSGNGEAFGKIGDAIRAYVTRSLQRPPVPAAAPLPADAANYAGWYEPASPRFEIFQFLGRLLGLNRVRFAGGNLLLSNISEIDQPFVPVSGEQFRYLPKKDHPEPVATAMLLAPNVEGRFAYIGGTVKRIPTWLAMSEIGLTVFFLLAFVSILLYAPFWIIGGLIKRRRRPAERSMRLWPLIAVLSLLAFVGLSIASNSDIFARLGNLTIWSFGLFLTTLIFAVASLASAVALWLARKKEIRRFVRWFSILATSALLIATVYLAYWGVIGIRTWA